ncbi:hypothetical protein [Enterobacter kobei]|uniref:hypothetical protein n=1 Tax=Enterobacter kobei TaxID=208224 RepID=UPI0021BE4FC1|nr:hypothetical protein [Enterobacter kobei]UXJ66734.1 hypothetical protein N5P26_22975 [Enterobacter kobei]
MIDIASHVYSLAVVVGVLAVDRIILRLRRLRLHDMPLGDVVDDGDQFLFPLRYKTHAAKHDGVVQYQLHDKKRPVLVIEGKSRRLAMAKGVQEEYLAINKAQVRHSGYWVLKVRVIHGKTFMNWNPLYRLFPFVDLTERTYTLDVGTGANDSIEK